MGFKRKKKKSLKKLFSVRKLVITIVSKYSYIVFVKYKKALKIDFENRVSDISKKI